SRNTFAGLLNAAYKIYKNYFRYSTGRGKSLQYNEWKACNSRSKILFFELEKSGKVTFCSKFSKKQIINNPEFLKLCKRLNSQARGLSINETIDALKIVTYIGIPAQSTIVQILLQLIRKEVNDLSLHEIIFVDFLLKNLDKNPLVDALKIALPLVFEAQLSLKMNRYDAIHLADLLHYATEKKMSDTSLNLIINSLDKVIDDIDVKTARTIVRSLYGNKTSLSSYNMLLTNCWNVLAQNIDQYSYNGMEELLHWMEKKYCKKQTEFYHEDFVDNCASYIVSKDCGFENGNWILRKLTRMCHVNLPLIDYLTDKIINDPKIGETCTPSLLLAYTTGVANADYKPAGWDRIQHILSNNLRMSEKELIEFPWLRLALNFAALDIYSPELLQHVFQEEFLNKFLSRDYNFLDNLQLLLLYQAVLTLYPSYSGPLPPKSMIEKVIAINGENINHFPLQAALEQGMGGSSYVWTKLLTKKRTFHRVAIADKDHLVVLRKGGYPVALNKITKTNATRTFVDDVTVPADAQLILVLCLPETFFNQNCKRLRAIPSLTLKTLESMGYIVVPVSLQLWTLLPEYEKIPYLMQNIKIRCESMEDDQARFVH
ncbi:hypothetical protein L9F63_009880, partial [Diploptera punctata]